MDIGTLQHNPPPRHPSPTELLVDSSTYVGVELEVTGVNSSEISRQVSSHFRCEPDGSLRANAHGRPMEFTFNQPKAGDEVVSALQALDANFKDNPTWELTNRGSTHVHLDVRDLTIGQLGWVVLFSAALEDHLFSLCGSSYRQNSHFCRSIKALPRTLEQAMKNIDIGDVRDASTFSSQMNSSSMTGALRNLLFGRRSPVWENNLKYTAINISAVQTFQSVEFRHFRPVCTLEEFLVIVNQIIKIKLAAKADNPVEEFGKLFEDVPDGVELLGRYIRLKELRGS